MQKPRMTVTWPDFFWDWLKTGVLYWFVFSAAEYVRRGQYNGRLELFLAVVFSLASAVLRAFRRPHVRASPAARRLAHQEQIDLNGVHGTGPDGRIIEQDVMRHRMSGERDRRQTGTQDDPAV